MTNPRRLTSHPLLNDAAADHTTVTITVDGRPLQAAAGQSLSTALWANGIITLGYHSETGLPRGMYCGIGHCYECRVTVDGIPDVRSCLTPVREGMCVTIENFKTGNGHDD